MLPIHDPAAYLVYMGLDSDTMQDAVEFHNELANERSADPNGDQ